MDDITSHIGLMLVSLHIPAAQSLKDKRMVIKSMKDRVRGQFNVSVAELGDADKWQTATLGFVAISNDSRHIDSSFQNILSLIEGYHAANICEHSIEFF